MNKWLSSLKWTVVVLAGGVSFLWAAPSPRNPNVRAENWVQIGVAGIQVKQVQTFQQQAAIDLWNKLDASGDGRLSPEEKKSAEQTLRPLFSGHTALRLNWQPMELSTVVVSIDGLPDRRPKVGPKPQLITVTFTASYAATASKADLVELSIPDLDAHECGVHFTWDAGFLPLRASMGKQGNGNVWDMSQTDGVPPSFSLVIHRQPSGTDSLPSKP